MQRSKMRQFAKYAKSVGLHLAPHRADLEEALSGCRNVVTRGRLRARILRVAVLLLVVGGFAGCASTGPRIVHRAPWSHPIENSLTLVDAKRGEILVISNKGTIWTWRGAPEDAVDVLVGEVLRVQRAYAALAAAPKPALKKAKK